ncbi:hypothetical protein GGX14DRAFT_603774 [Mycena pura]|uniref:Uncharacterized protein n=1 Tax=Mycena pura TaxID=153505 RepID=A0AAD6UUQ1_9AGAR|nr:hypothetical protein GGX14DRAFT_603774 [Mycena pura]
MFQNLEIGSPLNWPLDCDYDVLEATIIANAWPPSPQPILGNQEQGVYMLHITKASGDIMMARLSWGDGFMRRSGYRTGMLVGANKPLASVIGVNIMLYTSSHSGKRHKATHGYLFYTPPTHLDAPQLKAISDTPWHRSDMGVKNQTDVMPKLQRNKADVGIDPNARSAQGRSGRSGPKASGARNWIKHKSLGSPNEKCGTCEESNDQAYKARKSEREDRGCTQTRTKVSGPEPS